MKVFWKISVLVTLGGYPLAGWSGTVLTTVPMQGGMVHVELAYQAGAVPPLTVHIAPVTPSLLPLMFSHPGDSFDPAHPWCAAIDPGYRSLAFNRQYGFVLAPTSDPLPAGYSIGIRQLSASLGLEVYRYRANPPAFEPMFGTASSTNLLVWNLGMFHPAYVAPVDGATNATAAYEAFVMDSAGQPVGASTPFALHWQVAEPFQIRSWAAGPTELRFQARPEWNTWIYIAERTQDFITWTPVGAISNLSTGLRSLRDLDPPAGRAFYRLKAVRP